MCQCLFVEYSCTCSKANCPHHNPRAEQYHASKALFQIDHYKWRHCDSYLASSITSFLSGNDSSLDQGPSSSAKKSARQSIKRFFSSSSKANRKSDTNPASTTDYKSIDENGEGVSSWSDWSAEGSKESVVEVVDRSKEQAAQQLPVKESMDPRHGGAIPECESISYERWCIERRSCRLCEEYWAGGTGGSRRSVEASAHGLA